VGSKHSSQHLSASHLEYSGSKCLQTELVEGGRINRCSQRIHCEECSVEISGGGFTIDDDVKMWSNRTKPS